MTLENLTREVHMVIFEYLLSTQSGLSQTFSLRSIFFIPSHWTAANIELKACWVSHTVYLYLGFGIDVDNEMSGPNIRL